jgi:hypothetical protein
MRGSCGTSTPVLSRLNWSGYKEASYPGMPLLRVLNETGGLDTFQARWLKPNRPEIEFYDLKTDALGLHDVSQHPDQAADITKCVVNSMRGSIERRSRCGW